MFCPRGSPGSPPGTCTLLTIGVGVCVALYIYYVYSEVRRIDARYRAQMEQISSSLKNLTEKVDAVAATATPPSPSSSPKLTSNLQPNIEISKILSKLFDGGEDHEDMDDDDPHVSFDCDEGHAFCVIESDVEDENSFEKVAPPASDQHADKGETDLNQVIESDTTQPVELAQTPPQCEAEPSPAPASACAKRSRKRACT